MVRKKGNKLSRQRTKGQGWGHWRVKPAVPKSVLFRWCFRLLAWKGDSERWKKALAIGDDDGNFRRAADWGDRGAGSEPLSESDGGQPQAVLRHLLLQLVAAKPRLDGSPLGDRAQHPCFWGPRPAAGSTVLPANSRIPGHAESPDSCFERFSVFPCCVQTHAAGLSELTGIIPTIRSKVIRHQLQVFFLHTARTTFQSTPTSTLFPFLDLKDNGATARDLRLIPAIGCWRLDLGSRPCPPGPGPGLARYLQRKQAELGAWGRWIEWFSVVLALSIRPNKAASTAWTNPDKGDFKIQEADAAPCHRRRRNSHVTTVVDSRISRLNWDLFCSTTGSVLLQLGRPPPPTWPSRVAGPRTRRRTASSH